MEKQLCACHTVRKHTELFSQFAGVLAAESKPRILWMLYTPVLSHSQNISPATKTAVGSQIPIPIQNNAVSHLQ